MKNKPNNDLLYISYKNKVERILKWCTTHGNDRDRDFFQLGIHFALSNMATKKFQYGHDLSDTDYNSLSITMPVLKKYKIEDVFNGEKDLIYLQEYELWSK